MAVAYFRSLELGRSVLILRTQKHTLMQAACWKTLRFDIKNECALWLGQWVKLNIYFFI